MSDPTLTVVLSLHPEAVNGMQNAWKVEVSDRNGQPLLVGTAATAETLLNRAREYVSRGEWIGDRFLPPPVEARVA